MESASATNSVLLASLKPFSGFIPNNNQFLGQQGLSKSSSRFLNPSQKRGLKPMKKEIMLAKATANFLPALDAPETPLIHLKLEANVTVKNNISENLKDMVFRLMFDGNNTRRSERRVVLQLLSTELDSKTMEPKMSKEATLKWRNDMSVRNINETTYKVEFMVESNFGVPGAVVVTNDYDYEFFLQNVTLESGILFPCNSWVQPYKTDSDNRIFFASNALLPYQTPMALQAWRQVALKQKKGDGRNMRRESDRVYDYDVYNDLGNPDKGREFERPVMGGQTYAYPRRCRTGRPSTLTDWRAESPGDERVPVYVPRDERFGEVKKESLEEGKMKGILNNVIPSLKTVSENCDTIKCFSEINSLYRDKATHSSNSPVGMVVGKISDSTGEILKFDPPTLFSSTPQNP